MYGDYVAGENVVGREVRHALNWRQLPHAHPNTQAHALVTVRKRWSCIGSQRLEKNLLSKRYSAQKLRTHIMQCLWHLHCPADTPDIPPEEISPASLKMNFSHKLIPARNPPRPCTPAKNSKNLSPGGLRRGVCRQSDQPWCQSWRTLSLHHGHDFTPDTLPYFAFDEHSAQAPAKRTEISRSASEYQDTARGVCAADMTRNAHTPRGYAPS